MKPDIERFYDENPPKKRVMMKDYSKLRMAKNNRRYMTQTIVSQSQANRHHKNSKSTSPARLSITGALHLQAWKKKAISKMSPTQAKEYPSSLGLKRQSTLSFPRQRDHKQYCLVRQVNSVSLSIDSQNDQWQSLQDDYNMMIEMFSKENYIIQVFNTLITRDSMMQREYDTYNVSNMQLKKQLEAIQQDLKKREDCWE